MHKGYPHSMMIFAYLRTKLCSPKMKRDRLLIPSSRSRRTSRCQRPSLGVAAVAKSRIVVWFLPAIVVRGRDALIPLWQTPAVVTVDALTTTSIAASIRKQPDNFCDRNDRSKSTRQRARHVALRTLSSHSDCSSTPSRVTQASTCREINQ